MMRLATVTSTAPLLVRRDGDTVDVAARALTGTVAVNDRVLTDIIDNIVHIVAGLTFGGITDHGALTGLADDDHPQYHNDTRGDARYYTQGQIDTSLAGKANSSHTHSATDITSGTVPVTRGGTGVSSLTSGSYVVGNGTGGVVLLTPTSVRSDIGADNASNLTTGTLSSSRLPAGLFVPLAAYKSVATTVSSDATLSGDPDLSGLSVPAGSYSFDALIIYSSAQAADFQIRFYNATDINSVWQVTNARDLANPNGLQVVNLVSGLNTLVTSGANIGVQVGMHITGSFANTATRSFNVEWAQGTSNASNTSVHIGSFIRVWRLA